MAEDFSAWSRWRERAALGSLKSPGIYVIAVADQDLSAHAFSWRSDVAYVGMTNSVGGLASRLQQFDRTVANVADSHGGARRFRHRYADYEALVARLYVAVRPFECDVGSNTPADLRVMGQVAQHEYECFARFVGAHARLPEFNDKQRSPKK